MNGREVSFTADDLDAIADGYDPSVRRAPIVIGHPRHDAPAYGWVERVEEEGTRLYAVATDLAAPFVEWLEEEYYSERSASLWLPDQSPTGDWYLRHVGFLGAAPPAIPGLEAHQFADSGDDGSHTVTVDLSRQAHKPHDSDSFSSSDADPMPIDFAAAAHPGDVMEAAIEKMATDDRPRSALVDDLAEAMGIEPGTVNQILRGDITDVPEERLRAASAMLRGVSVDDLMAALPESATSTDMSADLARRERRLRARERRLEKREREARRDEAASFAASLTADGQLLPRHEQTVTEVLFQLEEAESTAVVDLSAHGGDAEASLVDALKAMLDDLGQTVEFAELAAAGAETDDTPGAHVDFEAPQGLTVANTDRMRLHKRARAYQQKNGVSYDEAVDAVS